MPATTKQLSAELIATISALPAFMHPTVSKAFSIYDMEDLESITQFGGLPVAGVSWEGNTPLGNEATPSSRAAHGVTQFTATFSVVVAMGYSSAASGADPKPDAIDLLDQIAVALMGTQGVNSRPWRLTYSGPVPSDVEDVIFYGQHWQTVLPVTGNTNQQ